MVFFSCPTKWVTMAQGLFKKWVWAQDCSPDVPSISENASDPVGIPLKRGASGARR